MSYELAFLDEALKEWRKLDNVTREQFKAKLAERLPNPKIPSARLHGAKERYKIKLRSAGYRLVYQVNDRELIVLVVAVGRRERNEV
jgi:mRNA interferase RelE/StbE